MIRTPDPGTLAEFYNLLGFTFDYHKHGNSPFHYSTTTGSTVLEIYPLTKGQTEADAGLRLGFGIDHFNAVVNILKERDIVFVTEPADTDFGFMCTIIDPDGRKLELYDRT